MMYLIESIDSRFTTSSINVHLFRRFNCVLLSSSVYLGQLVYAIYTAIFVNHHLVRENGDFDVKINIS